MRIGIDLDGVIYNSEALLRAYGEILDYDNGGKGLVDEQATVVGERHGWTVEQTYNFRKEYLPRMITESPLMPGALVFLQKLKEKGHELFIVTSRGWFDPSHVALSLARIKQDNIPADGIYHTPLSKLETCRNLKLEVMIDDDFKNVIELANNGIPCLYFHAENLKKLNIKNAVEITNLGQGYRVISDMDKKLNKEKCNHENEK